MNGYTGISLGALHEGEREIYRSVRCGLCHAIKTSCGLMYTPCLSNELVTLLLIKLSLQETDAPVYRGSCSISPFLRVPFFDYLDSSFIRAAQICVAVASEELADDVRDEPTPVHNALRRIVGRKVRKKALQGLRTLTNVARFFRLESDMHVSFDDLLAVSGDIALAAACDLYDCEQEVLPAGLLTVAYSLGKWIYLIDACDDWHVDIMRGSKNPLLLLDDPMEAANILSDLEMAIAESLHVMALKRHYSLVEEALCNNLKRRSAIVLRKLEGEVACR